MLILVLDPASKEHLIALCTERSTLALRKLTTNSEAELIESVKQLLADNHKTYEDLTHIVCVIGPGGFTSLRIGVTAANTLAWSLKIPLAGVHVSALWAARVQQHRPPFLWLHSTKKSQLFMQEFSEGKHTQATLVELSKATALQGEYVGELIPDHQEGLKHCLPIPNEQLVPQEEALPPLLTKLHYSNQYLIPWYGREG